MRPVRYVKEHPLATVLCLGVGYYLGSRGLGGIPFIGGLSFGGRASAQASDSGD